MANDAHSPPPCSLVRELSPTPGQIMAERVKFNIEPVTMCWNLNIHNASALILTSPWTSTLHTTNQPE